MILISLSEFSNILNKISSLTSYPVTYLDERRFPDGELLIKARKPDEIVDNEVILFHKLYPEQNKRFLELVQALDLISDYSPREITLIIPYLIYARQDKRFLDGECISLKALLKVISSFNVTKLITFDVHNEEAVKKYSNFTFRDISALPEITDYVRDQIFHGEEFMLISPDLGGVKRVRSIAEKLNLQYDYLVKERDKVTGVVRYKDISLDLKGLNVLVLDDIIATGGTVIGAGVFLKNAGAKKIVVGATHLLLLNNADRKILEAGFSEIVGSNTINTPYSKIEVEKLIAKEITKT